MYRIGRVLALVAALVPASVALGEIHISGAWVRAMPPTQSMTAGYMALHNRGQESVSITGASSDVSPRVEIHTTIERDGMQRMQPLDALELRAGERIELAPGGHHLMLRDMPEMPSLGDAVELCLTIEGADPVCASAAVASAIPEADSHNPH